MSEADEERDAMLADVMLELATRLSRKQILLSAFMDSYSRLALAVKDDTPREALLQLLSRQVIVLKGLEALLDPREADQPKEKPDAKT